MNAHRAAMYGGAVTRVQGVTGDQQVKGAPGILHSLLISNAAASIGTLTIKDGAATLNVVQCPANSSFVVEVHWTHATSIILNPSATTLDATALYD